MPNNEQKMILGIKVDKTSKKEILEKINFFLLSSGQRHIVTLNPEMIVEAQNNEYFKKIINEADISVADGIGVLFANKILNNEILPERIRGVDLIFEVCESDFVKKKKIFLLGAKKGIAERAATVLRNTYKYLDIVGAEEGINFQNQKSKIKNQNEIQNSKLVDISPFEKRGLRGSYGKNIKHDKSNEKLLQRINNVKPDILFVAFGAPKQEIWIYENLKKMPSVKLAIGVGGSFDFISGKIRRAPNILQKSGLEWLWRLAIEPKRVGRIYNATIKFGWLVLKNKIKKEG